MSDDYNDIVFQQIVQQLQQDFTLMLLLSLCVATLGKGALENLLETWTVLMTNVDTSGVSERDSERYIKAVWKVHDEIEKRLE